MKKLYSIEPDEKENKCFRDVYNDDDDVYRMGVINININNNNNININIA